MGKILVGLFMVLLDFDIHLDMVTIGIIPDFIGYIILIMGLKEMLSESGFFQKSIPLSAGMAVYSAICYLIALSGIADESGRITITLGLLNVACFYCILYLIIKGIEEMQTKYGKNLYANALKSIWLCLLVLNVADYLLILIPILALICIIFSLMATLVLLWYIYKAKEEYYKKILK